METLFANVPQGSTTSFVAQIRSKSVCRWVSVGRVDPSKNRYCREWRSFLSERHAVLVVRTCSGCNGQAAGWQAVTLPQGNVPLPSRSFCCCHCCCHYQFKPTAAPMDRDWPCKWGYAKCRRRGGSSHFAIFFTVIDRFAFNLISRFQRANSSRSIGGCSAALGMGGGMEESLAVIGGCARFEPIVDVHIQHPLQGMGFFQNCQLSKFSI